MPSRADKGIILVQAVLVIIPASTPNINRLAGPTIGMPMGISIGISMGIGGGPTGYFEGGQALGSQAAPTIGIPMGISIGIPMGMEEAPPGNL